MPLLSEDGNIIGLQIAMDDITRERRRMKSLAFLIKSLEETLTQRDELNNALKIDLERATAQQMQMEASIIDLQQRAEERLIMSAADIEKLTYCLQREKTIRINIVQLLQKYFLLFRDQISSARHLIDETIWRVR